MEASKIKQKMMMQETNPWIDHEDHALENFENQIAAEDYSMHCPWETGEIDENEAELEKARNYQFHPLWEPQEMSEKRKEQLRNYEYNPPYRCEFNQIKIHKKRNKRIFPQYNNKTISPWAQGALPGAPVSSNHHDPPKTVLWDAPPQSSQALLPFESSGDPILDSLRLQLRSRGATGICGLAKKFKIMDDDGSGSLNISEFTKAMRECEVIDLSAKSIAHLFRYFDRDDSGSISFDEFLVGIRGVLNARRKAMVKLAFQVIDKDGSGFLTVDDIQGSYNAAAHPDVIAGKVTENEVLLAFLSNFEGSGGVKDDIITLEEFESYYCNISSSIDDDDYFELMMRNAWHISGGEGWCGNTTNQRVLVTHSDGRQTVETIQHDMGLNAKDKPGLVAKLRGQGIAAEAVGTAYFGETRTNNNSRINSSSSNNNNNNNNNNNTNQRQYRSLAQELQKQNQAGNSNSYPQQVNRTTFPNNNISVGRGQVGQVSRSRPVPLSTLANTAAR